VEDWITRNEIGQVDGIEKIGTDESIALFGARFPMMRNLKAIAGNHINDLVTTAGSHGWRVDSIHLSPVGVQLGKTVLDQINTADLKTP
jgi:hypothetical protein